MTKRIALHLIYVFYRLPFGLGILSPNARVTIFTPFFDVFYFIIVIEGLSKLHEGSFVPSVTRGFIRMNEAKSPFH